MLRDEVRTVYNAPVDVIGQLFGQCAADDIEGAALVMRNEIFHVLQQEGTRALGGNDARHIEKQRPLGFTGEAVRFAQRILLRYSGNRERLAGKSSQQYIVIRDLSRFNLCDVAVN